MTDLDNREPSAGPEPEGKVSRVPILVVVGALVALVAIVAALVASIGDDDSAEIPLEGADGDADAREAFAVVEAAFAAYNSGDMENWARLREGSASLADHFEIDRAVDSRYEVERCTYRGFTEWDLDGPMVGHGFDCAATQTGRILDVAGIELEMTYNWVVTSDLQSARGGSNENFELVNEFQREFLDWLVDAHPEVDVTVHFAASGGALTVDSLPVALEHIDDFVAQSALYPLTEPVPEAEDYGGPLTP